MNTPRGSIVPCDSLMTFLPPFCWTTPCSSSTHPLISCFCCISVSPSAIESFFLCLLHFELHKSCPLLLHTTSCTILLYSTVWLVKIDHESIVPAAAFCTPSTPDTHYSIISDGAPAAIFCDKNPIQYIHSVCLARFWH